MKVIILGDCHFGCRNSNTIVEHWQRRFYEEIFWPYIESNGIQHIIQTGDYFDNRKWLNIQSIAFQKEVFIDRAQKLGVKVHGLVGNHDIPLRHSLKNSSVCQILNHEEGVQFYDEDTVLEFDGVKFTLVPWICKENEQKMLDVVREGGEVLVGHFEVQGALMHPGSFSPDGLKYSDFSKWKKVLSGHFHAQSQNTNVHFVGTPYQMSWNDATTKHGFWVFDTEDLSETFIENPLRFFNRFTWEDGADREIDDLSNSYVKINIKKKSDFEAFEKFIDKVNFANPFEVKITESFEEYSSDNVGELIEIHSTAELISEYIQDVTATNSEEIKKIMLEIYEEALQVEEQ